MFCFKVSSVLRCAQILEIVHFSVFGLFDRNVEIDRKYTWSPLRLHLVSKVAMGYLHRKIFLGAGEEIAVSYFVCFSRALL